MEGLLIFKMFWRPDDQSGPASPAVNGITLLWRPRLRGLKPTSGQMCAHGVENGRQGNHPRQGGARRSSVQLTLRAPEEASGPFFQSCVFSFHMKGSMALLRTQGH